MITRLTLRAQSPGECEQWGWLHSLPSLHQLSHVVFELVLPPNGGIKAIIELGSITSN